MKSLIAALLLTTASLSSFAQTPATPGVDKRQAKQEQRIDQGVASGSLTAKETRRLDKEQQRIDQMEAKARADGKVTARERRRLHTAQDAASADIARKKHNHRNGS
jgi:TolA-binding protein